MMSATPFDAWIFARQLAGHTLNGELASVSDPNRPLASHLNGLPVEARMPAFDLALAIIGTEAGPKLLRAVVDADATGPPPPFSEDEPIQYATLADYARIAADQPWLWPGWACRGVLNVVAAEPGTGKTRFALDLARRLWHGLPWPDGQENTMPAGSRTLWVQADRAFPEMLAAARAFGLPDEAVCLGSPPDDPTGCLGLDDPDDLGDLAARIKAADPAIVFIDTVGMTTARNLCRSEDARAFFGPLLDLAATSGIAIFGLTHLSASKEALGRRIVEKARIVIKMTRPDPEGQPNRRKLWVDKTAALNPPALGITMGDSGNTYDFNPPAEVEPNQGGRPAGKLAEAIEFVLGRLANGDRRQFELVDEWRQSGGSNSPIFDAFRALQNDGRIVIDDTVRPKIVHLNDSTEDDQ